MFSMIGIFRGSFLSIGKKESAEAQFLPRFRKIGFGIRQGSCRFAQFAIKKRISYAL